MVDVFGKSVVFLISFTFCGVNTVRVNVVFSFRSSPLLSDEADIELAALEVLPGVAHNLVEGVLQEVVPADAQSEDHRHPDVLNPIRAETRPSPHVEPTYFSFPGPWP